MQIALKGGFPADGFGVAVCDHRALIAAMGRLMHPARRAQAKVFLQEF